MKTFLNRHHTRHAGKQEMFRGRLVACHEVPARLDFVLAELQRRPLGAIEPPGMDDTALDAALASVHSARYLDFLQHAWSEWVALDPANAERDALPSVWPLPNRHGFRTDVLPENFAARLGAFAFDSGCPLTAGTWEAARAGAACAGAAAREVAAGARSAFALTRPPGHHAGPDYFGGYCFLNNAALAAQHLRSRYARLAALPQVEDVTLWAQASDGAAATALMAALQPVAQDWIGLRSIAVPVHLQAALPWPSLHRLAQQAEQHGWDVELMCCM